MTEVRFYHLTARTLERALPQLLEKTLQRGWRAVVRVGSEERAEALAAQLWTYGRDSFLPHGTRRDGSAEDQPIWITDADENPNRANVLFVADGAEYDGRAPYDTVCDLFDGNDADAVVAARARWKRYRDAGASVVYYQQADAGAWEAKQRSEA